MIIAGIDPGYGKMGVAIIEGEKLLFSDCLITSSKESLADRLLQLGQDFEKILKKFSPERLALEKLFFTTNQKTAMAVAEARGMITYLGRAHGLKIADYTPLEIKQTITGYGHASKKQVADFLPKLIKIDKKIKEDDELDAIAVALTDLFIHKSRAIGLQK
ncbi:MAG: crossover junction endodeoxyribonuclease RuvC [Patescibacteria group bacterium]